MENVRERLLEAAHAVFAEEGYRGATTRRIAARAGVNEVTLFRHFAGKDELLAAAIDRQVEVSKARIDSEPLPETPGDIGRELEGFLAAVLAGFCAAQQGVRTSMGEWGHHPELDERLSGTSNHIAGRLERYLRAAQELGLIRSDIHPVVAAQVVLAPVFAHGVLHGMTPERFPLVPDESIRAYLNVLLEGLVHAPGQGGD